MKFKPGVEFEMDTLDGRKMKTVCQFENPNKLIQKDSTGTIIREFTGSELVSVS